MKGNSCDLSPAHTHTHTPFSTGFFGFATWMYNNAPQPLSTLCSPSIFTGSRWFSFFTFTELLSSLLFFLSFVTFRIKSWWAGPLPSCLLSISKFSLSFLHLAPLLILLSLCPLPSLWSPLPITPSRSPQHADDVLRRADWLTHESTSLGTGGHDRGASFNKIILDSIPHIALQMTLKEMEVIPHTVIECFIVSENQRNLQNLLARINFSSIPSSAQIQS